MKSCKLVEQGGNALIGRAERVLRVGVAGLGRAFSLMLPAFAGDPRIVLGAAADERPEARARFTADFAAPAYETVVELCANPSLDAVYVATPHQHHAGHTVLAAQRGKHVLVEKPMALTLADCDAMIDAAQRANVQLVVGPSHSFDAPIRRTRELIVGGAYGAVRMISALNYTDYLYRPRRPEELDTERGGGAIFNQAPHQVDIVRLLGGGRVRSVRGATGAWDTARPSEGAYAAMLMFDSGAFASLSYSGYGHFDSDELLGWIGEAGRRKLMNTRMASRDFADVGDELAFKNTRNYGGPAFQPPAAEQHAHEHFGFIVVSCERADLRPMPEGVMIYQRSAPLLDALPPPAVPRTEVIDELYDAVVNGRAPLHDGAWGMATLEVCLAILQSARSGAEVTITRHAGVL